MFYDTMTKSHGLRNDPFKALVVPRPIGWITTIDKQGRVNLAPFSFFNAIAEDPPMVLFAPGGRKADRPVKDSRANAEETGEFVCNLATWDLREAMNLTSDNLAVGEDEMRHAGLTPVPSKLVKSPRVKESPVHFECKLWKVVELPTHDREEPNCIVIGEVVGIHIDDTLIKDQRVDIVSAKPIARLGYSEYTVVDSKFSMRRPG
ncbi:MAG TPA: flavin reductase family protein [Dongiaceae bacterium]|jgi:flavin reductase (DIM6/NTAB) family NADH-FMN oxidoreductase RutF